MNIHAEQPGAVGALALEGELTIGRAGELRTALINALDKVSHLQLNFEKVTDIDLSCLQLICSTHKTAAGMKKRLTVTGNSQTFKKKMEKKIIWVFKKNVSAAPWGRLKAGNEPQCYASRFIRFRTGGYEIMVKKIMTVDDSASMRQMIGFTLRDAGYDIVEATDGRDALTKLNASPVHMLISDGNMPNMNGFELVSQVRANPAYRFIPIIMLTTESHDSKKQTGKSAGATGWIVKPFKPEQLLAVVKKVLG